MKVIIIEDEPLAAERLRILLNEYDPSIEVAAQLDSVKAAVLHLKTKPQPDLLLLDIHLSDGHSFEIFKEVTYGKPVVFTTAFDDYALDAFKMLSVDYILKPVTLEALASAINKYKQMAGAFQPTAYHQLPAQWPEAAYKKRFLGKVGQRLFFVPTPSVSYFQADNKIVYLIDREGHRYIVEGTMDKLMEQLNPQAFFRVNRTYIIHIEAIKQIKPYPNNRLRIVAEATPPEEELIVSRERVVEFKEWANQG